MTTPHMTWDCFHCGQRCGTTAGGYGAVTGPDGLSHGVCSPADPATRPDCYRRIMAHREPLGALRGVSPLPAEVDDLRPPSSTETWQCAHCGQECSTEAAGYQAVTDLEGGLRNTCHPPVATARPDCYARITEQGEPLGSLIRVRPLPAGIRHLRRPREDAGNAS